MGQLPYYQQLILVCRWFCSLLPRVVWDWENCLHHKHYHHPTETWLQSRREWKCVSVQSSNRNKFYVTPGQLESYILQKIFPLVCPNNVLEKIVPLLFFVRCWCCSDELKSCIIIVTIESVNWALPFIMVYHSFRYKQIGRWQTLGIPKRRSADPLEFYTMDDGYKKAWKLCPHFHPSSIV